MTTVLLGLWMVALAVGAYRLAAVVDDRWHLTGVRWYGFVLACVAFAMMATWVLSSWGVVV